MIIDEAVGSSVFEAGADGSEDLLNYPGTSFSPLETSVKNGAVPGGVEGSENAASSFQAVPAQRNGGSGGNDGFAFVNMLRPYVLGLLAGVAAAAAVLYYAMGRRHGMVRLVVGMAGGRVSAFGSGNEAAEQPGDVYRRL